MANQEEPEFLASKWLEDNFDTQNIKFLGRGTFGAVWHIKKKVPYKVDGNKLIYDCAIKVVAFTTLED